MKARGGPAAAFHWNGHQHNLTLARAPLDPRFREHVDALDAKVDTLVDSRGYRFAQLPPLREMPSSGIYTFSDTTGHLYVGRSNRIRKRLANHVRPGATHYQASFAFRLARIEMGVLEASYTPEGSRDDLVRDPAFAKAFSDAKARLRECTIRFVEETDQVRQALLEIYAAIRLRTPHNDWATH